LSSAPEFVQALTPVVEALERLGVRHYVAGSVASAAHGVPRASVDADVVADLRSEHAEPLARRLAGEFYVSEDRVRDAIVRRRSFNVIHLATMFKVDVFVTKGRPFDTECLGRARPEPLPGATRPFFMATPEDVLLAKLEWFRSGGESSERQWTDVVGLLKARGPEGLDREYLERWARAVGVRDLLERAIRDAGWP
jgi:hypothetical protein